MPRQHYTTLKAVKSTCFKYMHRTAVQCWPSATVNLSDMICAFFAPLLEHGNIETQSYLNTNFGSLSRLHNYWGILFLLGPCTELNHYVIQRRNCKWKRIGSILKFYQNRFGRFSTILGFQGWERQTYKAIINHFSFCAIALYCSIGSLRKTLTF